MVSTVLTVSALGVGAVAVVLMFLARPLMEIVVPGRDPAFKDLAAELTRIMLVTPAVFAVSGFVTSVLQSNRRFGWAALAPVSYNLAIILCAVLLAPWLGIFAPAVGVVLGAFAHLVIQIPPAVRYGLRLRPRLDLHHPGVREIGRLFMPRMVGLGVVQLNQLINVILASFLIVVGALTALNVAWMVLMAPLTIAMAVGTALFPTLAEAGAEDRRGELRDLFSLALRMILFITVPMSLGIIVLATPLVRLLFQRGALGADSTQMIAYALSFYAIGLVGHATVEIADRVFYALHDTGTPVRVAVLAVGTNIALSLLLMQTPLSYGGLALANSIAALLEASVLAWLLSARLRGAGVELGLGKLGRSVGLFVAAAVPMGLVAYGALRLLRAAVDSTSLPAQVAVVLAVAGIGALVYFSLSFAFKSEELAALVRLFRPRGRAV